MVPGRPVPPKGLEGPQPARLLNVHLNSVCSGRFSDNRPQGRLPGLAPTESETLPLSDTGRQQQGQEGLTLITAYTPPHLT